MANDETRKQLINATIKLLSTVDNPEKITARQISGEAKTNLAMINYCFGSKDELIKLAADSIISAEFRQYAASDPALAPKAKLKNLLYHICGVTIKYGAITRLTVPHILLTAPIEIPGELLPYIKEHFNGTRDETYCRILAYEMISFFQIVFYRAKDFYNYSGLNIENEPELKVLIDHQVDMLLGTAE